ncbi:MAG: pyridoxal phosphate-dependent aminotransferase [Betaproteobacteria bacterium]|nr:MAG: pyridoxal phosphate-dependent aminotransferase [Betaproteobacteria bacterium]
MTLARRMTEIKPFQVMEIWNRAKELEAQGKHIIQMQIGEPDFTAPDPVIAASIEALQQYPIHYTSALGMPLLRQAISQHYRERYRLEVPAGRIVVTAGASGALLIAAGVLVDPGDEILMPDPAYPCNRHFVRFFEGQVKSIPVGPQTQYQLTRELIEANWSEKTRGVLIASPSNPTGTMIAPAEMRAIVEAVHARGGVAIVDEIYQGLTYASAFESALAHSDRVFVVNSFSKYFSMTGWRLGWLVAPEDCVRTVETFAQNAFICPSAPAQYAGIAAFAPETIVILEERRAEFRRRRDFLVPALRELGFSIPLTPEGAFYVYAGIERFASDSEKFALDVLEKAGVAITPGKDFGANQAERYVRFAYTRSLDDLQEGVRRLRKFLASD